MTRNKTFVLCFALLQGLAFQLTADGAPNSSAPRGSAWLSTKSISAVLDEREEIEHLGIKLANLHDFRDDEFKLAKFSFKFSDRLRVISVAKGSLGERLGLQIGDVMVELNGQHVPRGKSALQQLEYSLLPQMRWEPEVSATIIREGSARMLSVQMDQIGLAGIANGNTKS